MMTSLQREYKGYGIELIPRGEFCSNFAAEIRDASGNKVFSLKTAGDTEERAVARSREVIDFELAYRARES